MRQLKWIVIFLILLVAIFKLLGLRTVFVPEKWTYSIEGPSGWVRVSSDLTEEEWAKLPEWIREGYEPDDLENPDIEFYNLDTPDDVVTYDQLSIAKVGEPPPLEDASIEAFRTRLTQELGSHSESFEIFSMDVIKRLDLEVLRVHWTVHHFGVLHKVIQTFIPVKDEGLVVTCKFAENSLGVEALCEKSLETLVIE